MWSSAYLAATTTASVEEYSQFKLSSSTVRRWSSAPRSGDTAHQQNQILQIEIRPLCGAATCQSGACHGVYAVGRVWHRSMTRLWSMFAPWKWQFRGKQSSVACCDTDDHAIHQLGKGGSGKRIMATYVETLDIIEFVRSFSRGVYPVIRVSSPLPLFASPQNRNMIKRWGEKFFSAVWPDWQILGKVGVVFVWFGGYGFDSNLSSQFHRLGSSFRWRFMLVLTMLVESCQRNFR